MNLNKKHSYILALIFFMVISCKENSEQKKYITKTNLSKSSITKTIDSIYFDINGDGTIDRVRVIEDSIASRLLLVEINNNNYYKIIGSNSKIIDCSTCGYQSGDPFINLTEIKNGFQINLEYETLSFSYNSDNIFLDKVDILRISQTQNGIDESHDIYSFQEFDKINLSDLKENFELTLQKNKK